MGKCQDSNRTETEQDAIGVEVFTNAVGDAEIVQKLLEQRPHTLAQAYDIARRHENNQADSIICHQPHVLRGTQHDSTEVPCCSLPVIREGTEEEQAGTAAVFPAARCLQPWMTWILQTLSWVYQLSSNAGAEEASSCT